MTAGLGTILVHFLGGHRRSASTAQNKGSGMLTSATSAGQRRVDEFAPADRSFEEVQDVGSFLHPAGVVAPDKVSALGPDDSVRRSEFHSGNGGFPASRT